MEKDKPALRAIREMEINEMLEFPAERTSYIRSICARLSFELGKKYATHCNRERKTIEVTHIG